MNFSIDPNGEQATQGVGVVCPRCGGPAERRAATAAGMSAVVVTPSGLVMTEDTLRQLLMAQLSPAPGAQPEQMRGAIDAMVRGLRLAHDGDGVDSTLLEAIGRSMAEAQSQQAPPTAVRVLESLPKRRWKAAQTVGCDPHAADECAICLTAYQEGDELSLLPCKHELHTDCLTPWLKQTNSCPLCRHQLETDSQEYEERRGQQTGQGMASERPRPSPIQTQPHSPAASRGSGASAPVSGGREFGVHASDGSAVGAAGGSSGTAGAPAPRASWSSPSTADSAGSATASSPSSSPASARQQGRSGLRRGFLQDRGSRGLGAEGPSPQQAAAATMAGISVVHQVDRQDLRLGASRPSHSRTLRMPDALSGVEASEAGRSPSTPFGSPGAARDAESAAAADGGGGRAGGSGSCADPRSWSVRKLKGVLRNARVPHQDCVEKGDLVRRCLECRLDLAASEREYDAMLAAGRDDVGATRVPRQSAPAADGPGRPNARVWSPTTSAAASVLSNDWLSGARPAGAASSISPLASTGLLSSLPNGHRRDSLAGRTPGTRLQGRDAVARCAAVLTLGKSCSRAVRSLLVVMVVLMPAGLTGLLLPVQERNTATHNYARLPRLDRLPDPLDASRGLEADGDVPEAGRVPLSERDSDTANAPSTAAGRRPSSRNLYQRPSTTFSSRGGAGNEAAGGGVSTTAASPTGSEATEAAAAAPEPQHRRGKSKRPADEEAARPSSRGAPRRIRLGAVRDSQGRSAASDGARAAVASDGHGSSSLEQGGVSSAQRRPLLSLPNARGHRAAVQALEEQGQAGQVLSRPGSSSSGSHTRRPGSSAGLQPRTPSSSSWRPVASVEHQDSAAGRSAGAGGSARQRDGVAASEAGSRAAAGGASDGEASDGEAQALPAEDPYVRLLREREREWRGRTLQMMSGGEEGEGGSLVDRYVRLGR